MELDSLQNSVDFTDSSTVHTDRMDNTTKLQDLVPETKKSCVMAACPNSNISHGTQQRYVATSRISERRNKNCTPTRNEESSQPTV
jgi:hypothetical protein